MPIKSLTLLTFCCALAAQVCQSAPQLTITPGGIFAGNRQWLVSVIPDAALYANSGPSGTPPNTDGGSVATEIGFSVSLSNLVSVTKNVTNFPNDNPGTPIGAGFPTNTSTTNVGVQILGNNAVANLGSAFLTAAIPYQMVTITTHGSGPTKLSWFGAFSGKGRIAQGGVNFDLYSGSVSVPEPAGIALAAIGLTGALVFRRRGIV
jgi:hypothetical protein